MAQKKDKKDTKVKVRDLKPKKDAKGGGGTKPTGPHLFKRKEPHCGSIPLCGLFMYIVVHRWQAKNQYPPAPTAGRA